MAINISVYIRQGGKENMGNRRFNVTVFRIWDVSVNKNLSLTSSFAGINGGRSPPAKGFLCLS